MSRSLIATSLVLSLFGHGLMAYLVIHHKEPPPAKKITEPVKVKLEQVEPPPPPPPPPPEPRPDTPPPSRPKPKPTVTPPVNQITVPPQPDSPDVPFVMGTDMTPDVNAQPAAAPAGPVYSRAHLSSTVKNTAKYPREALREGAEGDVKLHLKISITGEVLEVSLVRSSRNRDLDRAARQAANSWKFGPATTDGVPQESELDIIVGFHLSGETSLDLGN